MKRISFFLGLLFSITVIFSSCSDDCLTCSYEDTLTGATVSEEACGSDDELDAFQFAFELGAAFSGSAVTCN